MLNSNVESKTNFQIPRDFEDRDSLYYKGFWSKTLLSLNKCERQYNWVGGAQLGLTVGLFLFGVTQGETGGFGSSTALGSLLGIVFAMIGFIWRIRTTDKPFIPLVLFINRFYVNSVMIAFFFTFTYYEVLVFVPLLIVKVNELTPGQVGLTL